MTPEVGSTVAILVLELDHAPPVDVELNVVVEFMQMVCPPLKVPAEGGVEIVTVRVAVTSTHPPVPVIVYVIIAVPADTPVMAPEVGSTVAILVLELVHAPPVTVEPNVVVPPTQIVCVPLRVPALVAGVTVTVITLDEALATATPPTVSAAMRL